MPEGDTIHNTARRLRDALAGRRVVRFQLRRDPHGLRVPQPGTEITKIEARGKHLLITFDDGAVLYTHMQLQGRWDVYEPRARWRRASHRARVIIEVDDGTTAVCFDAPNVRLARDGNRATPTRAERAVAALGPDLCTDDADLSVVIENVRLTDPRRATADVLLDQRIAAGIGNVFKCEICWACRVDPATPIGTLPSDDRRGLFDTAHRMLRENVGRTRRVTYQGGLAVYGRAGRPCPRCRTPIRRSMLGDPARVTYWCPACQRTTGA